MGQMMRVSSHNAERKRHLSSAAGVMVPPSGCRNL
jgi:hypothetical protein